MEPKDAEGLVAQLAQSETVSSGDIEEIHKVVRGQDMAALPTSAAEEPKEIPPAGSTAGILEGDDKVDIRTLLSKATLPQKIKYALFGNSICRAMLILDPNRMIPQFVLKNPRLQLREIEEFSKNPNLSDQILRAISNNQAWTKSYVVKVNLVFNAKTPSDIALKWLYYMNANELKKLARSKNVPQIIAVTARKKLANLERG